MDFPWRSITRGVTRQVFRDIDANGPTSWLKAKVGRPRNKETNTWRKIWTPGEMANVHGIKNVIEPFPKILVGGAITLLKNIWVRQWEGWHPIYEMENRFHVWNHQPAYVSIFNRLVFLGESYKQRPSNFPFKSDMIRYGVSGDLFVPWKPIHWNVEQEDSIIEI